MATYLTPGVYVEEIPAQSKPIEGVGTSTAAFIGLAPGGPINTPIQITNWTQFAKAFSDPANPDAGPFMAGAYLAHSVYGFFQNGGGICWVIRVGSSGNGGADEPPPAQAALPSSTNADMPAFEISAKSGATDVKVELTEEPTEGEDDDSGPSYKMVITAGAESEEFDGLTMKRGRSNLATKVNSGSKLVKIKDVSSSLPEEQRSPAPGSYALAAPAVPAKMDEISSEDYAGDEAARTGMGGLASVDDVNMICMPDVMTLDDDVQMRDLQGKMIAACEAAGERMCILDAPPDLKPQEIHDWRMNTAGYDSKFATLYYPWLEVMDPLTNQPMLVPPSGHVAGVWARTDGSRGVHKAPANEVVLGANGLGFQVTHGEQGSLNQNGVNCIRAFPGRGIRIWGARTLSSDPEWRYLNVRRLFNYLSESIINGTQWSVFEPNDERLWTSLRISTSNFLRRVWRDGALFGATPEQAFFVKCDAETNPPEVVEAGQVIVEIGVSPVKPAEFVVFRISQYTAGAAEVSE
jgi:phage tail sheath protein FI